MGRTEKTKNLSLYFNDDGKEYRADYIWSLDGISLRRKNKKGQYNEINANSQKGRNLIDKHNLHSKLKARY